MSVDNLGHLTYMRYDSRGNLVASADANRPVNSATINRRGLGSNASVTVNDYGNVELYYYDASLPFGTADARIGYDEQAVLLSKSNSGSKQISVHRYVSVVCRRLSI